MKKKIKSTSVEPRYKIRQQTLKPLLCLAHSYITHPTWINCPSFYTLTTIQYSRRTTLHLVIIDNNNDISTITHATTLQLQLQLYLFLKKWSYNRLAHKIAIASLGNPVERKTNYSKMKGRKNILSYNNSYFHHSFIELIITITSKEETKRELTESRQHIISTICN